MPELRPGLWHWQARHPEWEPTPPDARVSSYALDDGERLLLFDPLGVPAELEQLASERECAIVLTAPWHERDSSNWWRGSASRCTRRSRLRAVPVDTYGSRPSRRATAHRIVVWLLREHKGEARPFSAGDTLPFGVEVFPGHKPNDTVLWLQRERVVISGDTLVDFGNGLEINERWLPPGRTREQVAVPLRPLLELPVEHVLATHGGPTGPADLARALSSS